MKKVILISSLFTCICISTQAQFKSSIYMYAAATTANSSYKINPDFGFGYLKNLKNGNRHNVSATVSFGVLGLNSTLKYSYDYALIKNKKLTLYASPYVKVDKFLTQGLFGNYPNYYPKGNLSIGFQPSLEYKLHKNVQIFAAMPIQVISATWANKDANYYPKIQLNKNVFTNINVGARFNLFNKKK